MADAHCTVRNRTPIALQVDSCFLNSKLPCFYFSSFSCLFFNSLFISVIFFFIIFFTSHFLLLVVNCYAVSVYRYICVCHKKHPLGVKCVMKSRRLALLFRSIDEKRYIICTQQSKKRKKMRTTKFSSQQYQSLASYPSIYDGYLKRVDVHSIFVFIHF